MCSAVYCMSVCVEGLLLHTLFLVYIMTLFLVVSDCHPLCAAGHCWLVALRCWIHREKLCVSIY